MKSTSSFRRQSGNRPTLSLLLLLTFLSACSAENEITAVIDGEAVEFVEPTAVLQTTSTGYLLVITGKRADNAFGCQVNIAFTGALVDAIEAGSFRIRYMAMIIATVSPLITR